MTKTIKDLVETFASQHRSDSPQLDAQVFLARIINKPRSWVIAHSEYELTKEEQILFEDGVKRLEAGEPLPYVLGKWEFFGLDFEVNENVLIPRPETELLVEKAIAYLKSNPDKRSVADIGTGSGIIPISIAKNIPGVKVIATDISPKAIQVAKQNAEKHGVANQIEFVECDLFPHPQPLSHWERGKGVREFDLICANLPYIPSETMRQLPIYGKEPTIALDGGVDGLALIRRLFKLVPKYIAPHGMIYLEIESTLGAQTLELASDILADAAIHLFQDLAGNDRLLEISFP